MRGLLFVSLLLAAGCGLDVEPTGDVEGGGGGGGATVSFSLDVLPLLEQDCIICHGGAGGLNLESYEGVIAGGVSGAVVIPGNAEQSLLPRRLDGTAPPTMPLDAPMLTTPEVDRIKQWIDEGARDN